MSTREDIAAAVNAAGLGIDCKPWRPTTPVPGDAWPAWRRTTTPTSCVTERTWWLLVLLPGTLGETEQTAETYMPGLLAVGDQLGTVDALEPDKLVLQPGPGTAVPALRLTFRTTE